MKTKKIIYWVVTGVFCLMMLAAGAMEIFAFNESAAFVRSLGYPEHIAYVLPVTKILGVIAILSKKSKTLKEWAYAGFFFDFVLAALAHYFSGIPSPIPAVVAIILLFASYFLDREIYR
ncbi:MAG: DoxX family protein [Pyrinomonadaceae bacterium]|nr:DoxX family protein [Pyrinomonadaceae bacterium]